MEEDCAAEMTAASRSVGRSCLGTVSYRVRASLDDLTRRRVDGVVFKHLAGQEDDDDGRASSCKVSASRESRLVTFACYRYSSGA